MMTITVLGMHLTIFNAFTNLEITYSNRSEINMVNELEHGILEPQMAGGIPIGCACIQITTRELNSEQTVSSRAGGLPLGHCAATEAKWPRIYYAADLCT